jgi:hypothetical protein
MWHLTVPHPPAGEPKFFGSCGPIQTTRPRGRVVIGTQEPKNLCAATLRSLQGHRPKMIKVFLLLFVHKKEVLSFFIAF